MSADESPHASAGERLTALCILAGMLVQLATLAWFLSLTNRPLWLGVVISGVALAVIALMARASGGGGHYSARTRLGLTTVVALGALSNAVVVLHVDGAGEIGLAARIAVAACFFLHLIGCLAPLSWRLGGVTPATAAIVISAIGLALWLHVTPADIDVVPLLDTSAAETLRGGNPYGLTFPSYYDQATSEVMNGPGYVVDGRIPFGMPYPPVMLGMAVVGHLLGDVRLGGLIALTVAALVVLGRGERDDRRIIGLLLIAGPGVTSMLVNGWVEVLPVLLVVGVIIATRASRYLVAAACLGALMVSKQYMIVLLPCLWLLRPYANRQRVAVMLGAAAALTLPWLVASPRSFFNSLFLAQSSASVRSDSMSLLVAITEWTGMARVPAMSLISVGAGLGVAALIAIRARPSVGSFCLAAGLAVATTMLLAERSFFNYWFFVSSAFTLAGYATALNSVALQPKQLAKTTSAPPIRSAN